MTLDILKDRLYTSHAKGQPRRSAQTAIWHITESLIRLLSPALSFTAHEAWLLHRGESAETIFAQTAAEIPLSADAELLRQKWRQPCGRCSRRTSARTCTHGSSRARRQSIWRKWPS